MSPAGLSRRYVLWASGSSGWCRIGWAPLARQSATGEVAPEARALIADGAGFLVRAQALGQRAGAQQVTHPGDPSRGRERGSRGAL
jgi:hypothetical protein